MPEMDGVQAIREIKTQSPEIGIIILTTYDTDDYIFTGIEAGARGYLLKDSPPAQVLEAIRAVHRGDSLIQPSVATRVLDRVSQQAHGTAPEQVLSTRETEVLQLISTGAANKEIAAQLLIGESTVKTHVIHIFNKLGVKGRTEAAVEAARRGIIKL
ncbi:MAG: response regulator transcription factor [Chloroflexi bacterium]|nr:response regulator transcription factor [Chloroflexota bacterium]